MKYKVGDKIRIKSLDWYNENKDENREIKFENGVFTTLKSTFLSQIMTIEEITTEKQYILMEDRYKTLWTDEMIEELVEEEEVKDMGEVSDGYHTFNELYEYRLLYNASMFNELAKQNLYNVHKSKRHSDGEIPFGDSNWFIVMAELPTGQISNHYEMKDWDLFQIPEKETANKWDGHTPKDVTERLRRFLTPKPKYPKTYEECCNVLDIDDRELVFNGEYRASKLYWKQLGRLNILNKLLICRDAYWKIAGEEMGLGKDLSWVPDWMCVDPLYAILYRYHYICKAEVNGGTSCILAFPTAEMRDAFYENFKELIDECKELL